jgi:hypothetical protein
MIENQTEKLFRKEFFSTKRQVINALKRSRDNLDNNGADVKFTPKAIKIYKQYFNSIIDEVEKATIPKLDELWWHYNIFTDIKSIYITICDASEVEIKPDSSSMTIEFEETIFNVEAKYLSLNEYASLHNLPLSKISKWIDKGYLRSIKLDKHGEYSISELECPPTGDIFMVDYRIVDVDKVILPEFPTIKFAKEIHLYQFENNSKVTCHLWGSDEVPTFDLELTKAKAERLQYLLNHADGVEVVSSCNELTLCY